MALCSWIKKSENEWRKDMKKNKQKGCLGGALLIMSLLTQPIMAAEEKGSPEPRLDMIMREVGQERDNYYRISNDAKVASESLEQKIADLQRQLELEQARLKTIRAAKLEEEKTIAGFEKAMQEKKRDQVTQILAELKKAVLELKSFIAQGEDFTRDQRLVPVEDLLHLLSETEPRVFECAQRSWSVFEAELEASKRVELRKGVIRNKNGDEQAVEFLRIGAVVLLYRSVTDKDTLYGWGRFKDGQTLWMPADKADVADIALAYDMVEHKKAPGFSRLPLLMPQVTMGGKP